MATANAPEAAKQDREIRIISHSTLYYWWIVWAVGFLMAIITFFSHDELAVVPEGTVAYPNTDITTIDLKTPEGGSKKLPKGTVVDILVTPAITTDKGKIIEKHRLAAENPNTKETDTEKLLDAPREQPHLRMSPSKNLGVFFCTVLLLVIIITNVPLRGLWSVIVIFFIISISIIFALADLWRPIMSYLTLLDVRINLAGYMLISGVLFVAWVIVFFFFDQQIYMVFTPGQLKVRLEIGDAETAYDTAGMTIQKQRSDIFRHWILGLGSGDLIVKTAGAQTHTFDMVNVLFLGRKVKDIEDMLKTKQVVSGASANR